MEHKIKDFFTKALINAANEQKKHYDPVTGRFMDYVVFDENGNRIEPEPNKGWAITHQDYLLGFAYLYKTPFENNPYYMNPETYDMILKGVQAWRNWQGEDGRMEFIKSNGECWGPIYMPWSWYHWLETYGLMRDDLSDEVRSDWEKGMWPGLESYAKQDPTHIHNIPVWQAMCVHRAGKFFDRQDWCDAGSALIENCCKLQHPDGFWAEHQGPATGYNQVYIHSLALYYVHGGSVDVLPALKRAIQFTKMFTYPNGIGNDTIDGRQHYHPVKKDANWSTMGIPAYAITKSGLVYLNSLMGVYSQSKASMAYTTSLLLALASHRAIDDVDSDDLGDTFAPDFTASYGSATVVRKNNNQITLSAYTAPLTESRWGMDRQFFASVWTEDADLLMGSANSKNHIELSTFVIGDQDGKVLSYIPTAGKVVKDGVVSLDYSGYAECTIEGSVCDCGKLKLTYSAKLADPAYCWRVSLPLNPDFEEKTDGYRVCVKNGQNCIEFKGWRVSFTGDYKLYSPIRPFNPYVKNGDCAIENYLLAVNIYPEGDSLEVTFEKMEETAVFFDDTFVPTNKISK